MTKVVEGAWHRPDGRFVRNVFMDIAEFDDWRHRVCRNTGVYRSAYRYSRPLVEDTPEGRRDVAPQDVLLYEGFYMDLDKNPLDGKAWHELKQECERILDVLETVLGIDENQVGLAFSGSKGVHLYIPPEVLGVRPAWNLNEAYRHMAERIATLAQLPSLDLKIYDRRRVLRVVNSVHNKTGLYKIPLTWEEFRSWSLGRVMAEAGAPRERQPLHTAPSPKAQRFLRESFERIEARIKPRTKPVDPPLKGKMPPCFVQLIDQGATETDPGRNRAVFAIASFLWQQGLEEEKTLEFLLSWAQDKTYPPLGAREVTSVVRSVYRHGYIVGCRMMRELTDCKADRCRLKQ